MEPEKNHALDKFFEDLPRRHHRLLLLDYDGTLAPFTPNRLEAFPAPRIIPPLEDIIGAGRTRVVFVSGRDSEELVQLLGLKNPVEIWGCHGREYRGPDGRTRVLGVSAQAQESLREGFEAARAAAGSPERAEYKTGCATVHWRGMSPREREHILEAVLPVWRGLAARHGFDIKDFDGGIELCVPGRTKGDAVESILAEYPGETPATAFLGDDLTDEDGFAALGARGLSVLVRNEPRSTRAQARITMPAGVVEFLQKWREIDTQ